LRRLRAPLLALALLASGCGPYSFSPSGKASFKNIAVPLFENQTREYGIRELLTEGVINRFIQDGSLKVVNETHADAVLHGSVLTYARQPYTYAADESVQEYRVIITIQARLEDPVRRKVLWEEKELVQWGNFKAQGESEDDGKSRAVDKLAEDIVNRTVRSW
jgi:lipopolysaccharide assembly LptE-like protein